MALACENSFMSVCVCRGVGSRWVVDVVLTRGFTVGVEIACFFFY